MRNLDLRRLLSIALVYRFFRRIVTGTKREALVIDRLALRPGHRLLDMGCGTGDALGYLPRNVAYVGVDASQAYIEAARERHGHSGEFHLLQLGQPTVPDLGRFDRVRADGVIHHLDQKTALALFALAANVLQPAGHLVTIDPLFVEGQGWLARRLISGDRGEHVRTEPAYLELARRAFGDIRSETHRDLLRLPYNHILMSCRRPTTQSAPPASTR